MKNIILFFLMLISTFIVAQDINEFRVPIPLGANRCVECDKLTKSFNELPVALVEYETKKLIFETSKKMFFDSVKAGVSSLEQRLTVEDNFVKMLNAFTKKVKLETDIKLNYYPCKQYVDWFLLSKEY